MPIRGLQLQTVTGVDPLDSTWNLVSATNEADVGNHPFMAISLRTRYRLTKQSCLVFSGQFLTTIRPYFTRHLTVESPSVNQFNYPVHRRFMWFALSLGYEFSWGKPPSKREKRNHRERAPYWLE